MCFVEVVLRVLIAEGWKLWCLGRQLNVVIVVVTLEYGVGVHIQPNVGGDLEHLGYGKHNCQLKQEKIDHFIESVS